MMQIQTIRKTEEIITKLKVKISMLRIRFILLLN